MLSEKLFDEYLSNDCINVWNTIKGVEYDLLDENQKGTVDQIITEVLRRIHLNIEIVVNVFDKYRFTQINYGDINTIRK